MRVLEFLYSKGVPNVSPQTFIVTLVLLFEHSLEFQQSTMTAGAVAGAVTL
jgi:hypothetical protein